jgi:hypothetical protein
MRAWIATTQDIDSPFFGGFNREVVDVVHADDSREMGFQDDPASRVFLNLPSATHAGPGKADVESSDPGEQRAEDYGCHQSPRYMVAACLPAFVGLDGGFGAGSSGIP